MILAVAALSTTGPLAAVGGSVAHLLSRPVGRGQAGAGGGDDPGPDGNARFHSGFQSVLLAQLGQIGARAGKGLIFAMKCLHTYGATTLLDPQ